MQTLPKHGVHGRDVLALVHAAVAKGILPDASLPQVRGLAVMRNLAIHGPEAKVTAENAREFLTLVDGAIYAMGYALDQ